MSPSVGKAPSSTVASATTAGARSFFTLGTPGVATEEARVLFRDRLALYFAVVAILSGAFFLSNVATLLFAAPKILPRYLSALDGLAHLGSTLLAAVFWAVARYGKGSVPTLHALDTAGTLFVAVGYALMAVDAPKTGMPEIGVLLATTFVLTTRAAFVPSDGKRTLVLGVAASIPCIFVSYAIHAGNTGTEVKFDGTAPAWFFALSTAKWSAVLTAVTASVSRVVYGLQQQVTEAMQLGQYTLEEKIGTGGMGVVYRARHALLRRPTAIKLLPPERTSEHDLQRFEREVQLTSTLTHPNTIAIYDFGRTPAGVFYYAMEYLEGVDLESLVRRSGPQSPSRVIYLLDQVCGALAEAHDKGLIHRDIKPANLIVCERGGVQDVIKVLDFGLVKSTKTEDASLSRADVLTGTPLYLAPEAITSPETLDARADLYALGAVAFYLLTGRPVFEGRSVVEVCSHHLHTKPERPSAALGRQLPRSLEDVILRCLAKDREARPASAIALRDELRACTDIRAWTEGDAHDAWNHDTSLRRRGGVKLKQKSNADLGSLGKTVAVDLKRRDIDAAS